METHGEHPRPQRHPGTGQGPDCTETGWREFYQCDCGKFFADPDCTREIRDPDTWKSGEGRREKLPHIPGPWLQDNTNHWKECTVCHTVLEQGEHQHGRWEIVTEATKTQKGLKIRTCSVCGHQQIREIPVRSGLLDYIPRTGDSSHVVLWGAAGLVSLAGAVTLLALNRRKKQGRYLSPDK